MSEVNLKELVDTQRVIVCAGAGGVGKTSVAASMALGAARGGKRVLVIPASLVGAAYKLNAVDP